MRPHAYVLYVVGSKIACPLQLLSSLAPFWPWPLLKLFGYIVGEGGGERWEKGGNKLQAFL